MPYGMQIVPVLVQGREKNLLKNLFGLSAVAIDVQQDTQSLVQVNTEVALMALIFPPIPYESVVSCPVDYENMVSMFGLLS